MMLKALLKVRLAAFGAYFTGASRSRRRQSKVQKIGMLAVMLYALAAFGMLFYTSFSAIAGIYAHEGFGWLYFAMYAIMAFALMVFGSVFTAKAQLYEAKDNELLLSMPIAPRAILASRMASLWLLNLIFGLVVAVPAALAWAQAAALPVLGWVSIVLLLPALDFFSLAVTSLLAWGLSLLASRLRRKSLVTVIGSVVFLGAYFAVIFRMNGYIEQLAQNGAAIAESLAGAKLLVWLGRAMAQGSALALLWSLLALLLPFALMYWVLSRSFIRIVTTKRGAAKIRYEEKTLETSSPDRALVRREFRRLWASPTYLLNAGMGVLFLLVGAAALVIRRAAILDLAVQLPELAASVPVFLLLAICGMLGTTLFTPSSVSLEGKNLWILQSMPVSGCQVLLSKLRMADSLTLPTAAVAGICCASVTRPGAACSGGRRFICALCESAGTARGCSAREARLDERGAGSQAGLGDDAHHASLLGRHSGYRRAVADVAGRACKRRGVFAWLLRGLFCARRAAASLGKNDRRRTVFAPILTRVLPSGRQVFSVLPTCQASAFAV